MKVNTAKNHMEQITSICDKIKDFDKKHMELNNETGFLCDAVGFLCDYRKVLEKAIDEAELKL